MIRDSKHIAERSNGNFNQENLQLAHHWTESEKQGKIPCHYLFSMSARDKYEGWYIVQVSTEDAEQMDGDDWIPHLDLLIQSISNQAIIVMTFWMAVLEAVSKLKHHTYPKIIITVYMLSRTLIAYHSYT